jgi:hypothetical protein
MKEIILKPKGIALVDDEDFEYLNQFNWYLSKVGYAIGGELKMGIKAFIKMHRLIMGVSDPKIKIDHKNRNKLDNRKCNLRICTPAQNSHNSTKRRNTKNNYKGVFYISKFNIWQSRCRMMGYDIFLGNYKSEIAAAYAYNKKAIELSSYANINYLPYDIDYLEKILKQDYHSIKSPIQSKYKFIYFKKRGARMKCDKWYISFLIANKRFRKGYFDCEKDAVDFLIKNYSVINPESGSFK